ncbi:MAG: extracellular matrix regulator RemB [Bacillota bacterium]
MFLHIGNDNMIKAKDVVLIGDMSSIKESEITQEFLKTAEEEGFIIDQTEDKSESRSFILTGEKIFFSIISTSTLEKRMENLIDENEGV